ncbi:tRNA pseudouridine38-40 synthase [Halohasta litchfieldiae]|jgi:tRNA pseudouridine38-40 synthase|uniref:tRNA pseudouridine synthase A n=1 Tax=Halohasta litchfieldiae TaxID=1073996 RepID=A0A1H6UQ42_9EURY|nr:tRNA pseudouridine(38-40) synthase TruA [Halohasta litchfieldiae]ATW87404.1 tRNA pseudouridine38-40 synthase [Halohasta litchfieldiae]SEI90370.1 tRNA pseudouridine38-40 synthase [Halohasta litchfieldiae]
MRAFRLAYDGRPFYGFQRQPDVPTVEDTLFDALRSLSVLSTDASRPVGYAAAGRTDTGVSAVAQTVAFDAPEWLKPRVLNSELPGTIRAWASADVDDDFHATHHAVRREYSYRLYAPQHEAQSFDGRPPVDADRAAAALTALCGSHDFHNLTPDDEGTRRGLSGWVDRDGEFLLIEFAAGGFARELVRRLVSVIRLVGTGHRDVAWIENLLGPEPVEQRPPAAPPEPLLLSDVRYPGVDFERDPEAAESGAVAFGERAIESQARSRVSRAVVDRLRGGDQ